MPTDQQKAIMAQWQALLVKAGYPLPKYGIDGLGGTETRDALLAFQKDHGLPQTGQLDDATRAALNPPVATVSPSTIATVTEIVAELAIPPSPAKDLLMNFLPTIVQFIVTLLPGIPDDINVVEAELKELASTDTGIQKLRSALQFGQTLISKIEAVLDQASPPTTTTTTPATPASSK